MKPIRIGTRFYKNRSLPVSTQNLINLFIETQGQDARSPVVAYRTPGLNVSYTAGSGPHRGFHKMDGVLYVVSGTELYSITTSGTATLIGTVPGTKIVGMASNDREADKQLAIVNGTTTQYTYTVSGGLTTTTLTGPANTITYQDGYFIYDWAGTGKWFISKVLDGTTFISTETGASNEEPDNVIAVISNHQQIWVFGTDTYSIHFNNKNLDFPFLRISEAVNDELGLGALRSLVEMDNTIYWVGSDREVYRAQGYNAEIISTPSVSDALKDTSLDSVEAFTYTSGGHKFYQLNTDEISLVFDARENAWHQRSYFNGKHERHRARGHVVFNNELLVGDYENGNIYKLDNTHYKDNTKPIRWEMTLPPLHNNNRYLHIPSLYIDIEVGTSKINNEEFLSMEHSNDGRTWSYPRAVSLGKTGKYTHVAKISRIGGTQTQKILNIHGTSDCPFSIYGVGVGV